MAGSPVIEALVRAGFGIEEAVKRKRTLEEIYLDVVREAGGMQDGRVPGAISDKRRGAE